LRTSCALLGEDARRAPVTPGTGFAPVSIMSTTMQLLALGNDALARGDRWELASVARRLSSRVGDPLRDELLVLAALCPHQHDSAARRWPNLRDQIALRVECAGT
jgi:hypothetical protein